MTMVSRSSRLCPYRRAVLWSTALAAACAASLSATPATAQADPRVLPFTTSTFPPPGFDPSGPAAADVIAPYRLRFYKSARRFGCDDVSYKIWAQLDVEPGLFGDPAFAASVTATRFDVRDELPKGLTATRVEVGGDSLPVASPLAQTGRAAGPVIIPEIRFDPTALSAGKTSASFVIDIDARIDRAAFAAPGSTSNMASLEISNPSGPYATIGSHDSDHPEDADEFSGAATALAIDMAGCDPVTAQTAPAGTPSGTPAAPAGAPATTTTTLTTTTRFDPGRPGAPAAFGSGEACFKLVEGEILCSSKGTGTYVYRMPVGPEMGGRTAHFMALTPGIVVDPPVRVVPNGGGVVEWAIHGALPGMTLRFSTIGQEVSAGPAEGWSICCTQLVEVIIPVEPCPPRPEPKLDLHKEAVVGRCQPGAAECTFRITITNHGTAPHVGEVSFSDRIATGSARIVGSPAAPWRCSPATTPTTCRRPSTTVAPGQSVSLDLSLLNVTGRPWAQAVNCAFMDLPAPGGRSPGSRGRQGDCAIRVTPPPPGRVDDEPPPRLVIAKRALAATCSASGDCEFLIDFTNTGGRPYRGPLAFDDLMAPVTPTSIRVTPARLWACQTSRPGASACRTTTDIVLPPGATTSVRVRAKIDVAKTIASAGGRTVDVNNCAILGPVAGAAGAGAQSCATTRITIPDIGRPSTPPPPLPVRDPPRSPSTTTDVPVPPGPVAPDPVCKIPGQVLNAGGRCVCAPGRATIRASAVARAAGRPTRRARLALSAASSPNALRCAVRWSIDRPRRASPRRRCPIRGPSRHRPSATSSVPRPCRPKWSRRGRA